MTGKRQHYIPRFLQRGFLHPDPVADAGERIWQYRKGAEPLLVGIRDAGVEDWFYSRKSVDGSPTLDDLITKAELPFLGHLADLRSQPMDAPVDPDLGAHLVVHLVMRTKSLRRFFTNGAHRMIETAAATFSDPEAVRDMLGLDGQPSEIVAGAIDSALAKLPEDDAPRPLLQRAALYLAREKFDVQIAPGFQAAASLLRQVTGDWAGQIRDAHNRALENSPEETAWHTVLRTFTWRIVPAVNAILPDCVGMAWEAEGEVLPFLLTGGEVVAGVALPIASDRILIGRRPGAADVDLHDFNRHAALCSDHVFLARDRQVGEDLVGHIGHRAAETLESILDGVVAELRGWRRVAEGASSAGPVATSLVGSGSLSYDVTLADFGDEAMAASVAEAVGAVVGEVGRALPLDHLEGITFAVDYAGAVAAVDRGNPDLPPEATDSRDYGRAVAKSVDVWRDNRARTRLVVDAIVAAGLLSEDPSDRTWAAGLLAKQFAIIAHTALYVPALADIPRLTDPMAIHLHGTVSQTPGNFFAARWAAFAESGAGAAYAELTLDSLRHAQETVRGARLKYRTDGDLQTLVLIAGRAVGHVLGHAAEWLGHRAGLPEGEALAGDDLPSALAAQGLDAWLELLGRDLERVYAQSDRLDYEVIGRLHRHAERLLWTLQICPWPVPDRQIWWSVPWGDDLALLSERDGASAQPA